MSRAVWQRLAILAVLAVALLGSVPSDPAAAAGVNYRIHEFNMCGWKAACPTAQGSPLPAYLVVDRVKGSSPKPVFVFVNEVCFNGNQSGVIASGLASSGYTAAYGVAVGSGSGVCGGSGFGNMVLALGTPVSAVQHNYANQDGDNETRNVICRKVNTFLGVWGGCATHLENHWMRAIAQMNELYSVGALGGNSFRVIGGDFNNEPHWPQFDQWRWAYEENDEFAPFEDAYCHSSGCAKIDYVWSYDLNVTKLNQAVTSVWQSDHHYYSSNFRIEF